MLRGQIARAHTLFERVSVRYITYDVRWKEEPNSKKKKILEDEQEKKSDEYRKRTFYKIILQHRKMLKCHNSWTLSIGIKICYKTPLEVALFFFFHSILSLLPKKINSTKYKYKL